MTRSSALARRSARGLCGLAAVALVFAASGAEAGSRVLRWTQADGNAIAGFRIHIGNSAGRYERLIVIERGEPNENGVYSAIVDLGDSGPVYVGVTAYDRLGRTSRVSNERSFPVDSLSAVSPPGAPTPR